MRVPAAPEPDAKYPCADCGVMRTKAEGGTTFTVCDECWDKRRAADAIRYPNEAQLHVDTQWLPSAENVNALPEPIRRYIHDIETRCDPAGEVRELTIARDTIRALTTPEPAAPEPDAWTDEYKRLRYDVITKVREHEFLRSKREKDASDSYVNMAVIGLNAAVSKLDEHVLSRAADAAHERVPPAAQAEIDAFRERLVRKGRAVEAARLSLIERAREFVDEYGYTVPLDPFVERTRAALEEYDRVSKYEDDDYGTGAGDASYEVYRCTACGQRRYVELPD